MADEAADYAEAQEPVQFVLDWEGLPPCDDRYPLQTFDISIHSSSCRHSESSGHDGRESRRYQIPERGAIAGREA